MDIPLHEDGSLTEDGPAPRVSGHSENHSRMRSRRPGCRNWKEASEILVRRVASEHCGNLGDLLGPEGRPFHRRYRLGRLKFDKGFETQGWTSPHGKSSGKEDRP